MNTRVVDPAGDAVVREFGAKRALSLVGDGVEACPVCSATTCEDPAHMPPPDAQPGNGKGSQADAPATLRAQSAADVMCEPCPVAIIEGIAWARRVTVLVSESGAGKTFELLGAGAAVADGRNHHGRATRRGSVAYCSYEGDALGLRLRALKEVEGFSLEDLHVIRAGEPLSPRIERDGTEHPSIGETILAESLADLASRLSTAGRLPIVLGVVDTIRASLAGSEDRSDDVAAYLRVIRRLGAPYPDAAWILAHHAGWQDGEQKRKRERGSSAFRGNADATLYLEVTEEDPENHRAYLTLRALKVRDDERSAPLRLVRRRVDVLELDDRGQPRTSCIIERDPRRREDIEAERAKAKAEADLELEQRALAAIAENDVASIAALRALLGCAQPVASDLIAKLVATGRIARKSQREPYRVVPSRTDSHTGTSRESYRTARPIGGTSTTRPKDVKKGSSRTGRGGRS